MKSKGEFIAKTLIFLVRMAMAGPLALLIGWASLLFLSREAAFFLAGLAATVWIAISFLWARRHFDEMLNH